jgi:NAD(P)H-quinone oxidoreductase subunit 5
MVLQCGLGLIPAAITHLLLHGFYKAYLFLATGSAVTHTRPTPSSPPTPSLAVGLVSGASALGGGVLFALLTGKSLTALDSGFLLTVFVVLAVLHATRSIVRRAALPTTVRLWAVPALLLSALGVYAAVYNGVSALLGGLPGGVVHTPLTPVHWALAAVFVLAYVAVERGWHRASTRLYVTLLNSSQPVPTTLLHRRDQYNAY